MTTPPRRARDPRLGPYTYPQMPGEGLPPPNGRDDMTPAEYEIWRKATSRVAKRLRLRAGLGAAAIVIGPWLLAAVAGTAAYLTGRNHVAAYVGFVVLCALALHALVAICALWSVVYDHLTNRQIRKGLWTGGADE